MQGSGPGKWDAGLGQVWRAPGVLHRGASLKQRGHTCTVTPGIVNHRSAPPAPRALSVLSGEAEVSPNDLQCTPMSRE